MDNILKSTAFGLAEHKRNVYQAYPEPDLTPEGLLAPDYWSNVAQYLRPYDRIEALAEDGAWLAEYLVLEAGHNWARVALLASHDLKAAATKGGEHDDYEIKYRGVRKFSVVRKKDNSVMKDGMQTRDEAIGWLGEHLKGMAA